MATFVYASHLVTPPVENSVHRYSIHPDNRELFIHMLTVNKDDSDTAKKWISQNEWRKLQIPLSKIIVDPKLLKRAEDILKGSDKEELLQVIKVYMMTLVDSLTKSDDRHFHRMSFNTTVQFEDSHIVTENEWPPLYDYPGERMSEDSIAGAISPSVESAIINSYSVILKTENNSGGLLSPASVAAAVLVGGVIVGTARWVYCLASVNEKVSGTDVARLVEDVESSNIYYLRGSLYRQAIQWGCLTTDVDPLYFSQYFTTDTFKLRLEYPNSGGEYFLVKLYQPITEFLEWVATKRYKYTPTERTDYLKDGVVAICFKAAQACRFYYSKNKFLPYDKLLNLGDYLYTDSFISVVCYCEEDAINFEEGYSNASELVSYRKLEYHQCYKYLQNEKFIIFTAPSETAYRDYYVGVSDDTIIPSPDQLVDSGSIDIEDKVSINIPDPLQITEDSVYVKCNVIENDCIIIDDSEEGHILISRRLKDSNGNSRIDTIVEKWKRGDFLTGEGLYYLTKYGKVLPIHIVRDTYELYL